jgi:hypothetical protein
MQTAIRDRWNSFEHLKIPLFVLVGENYPLRISGILCKAVYFHKDRVKEKMLVQSLKQQIRS